MYVDAGNVLPATLAKLRQIAADFPPDLSVAYSTVAGPDLAERMLPALPATLRRAQIVGMMIVTLAPWRMLPAHIDARGGRAGSHEPKRFHIVLETNPGAWCFHDDAFFLGDPRYVPPGSPNPWQQLALGRVYEMDPGKLHGAVNWHNDPRRHLVIDAHL